MGLVMIRRNLDFSIAPPSPLPPFSIGSAQWPGGKDTR
jgi:hypothetical protein